MRQALHIIPNCSNDSTITCLHFTDEETKERKVKVKSLSHVRLFVTLWIVAYQASPSMGFSRQEYQSGLPFPSPGIFPTQASNPGLPHCRQTLYPLGHQGSPRNTGSKLASSPALAFSPRESLYPRSRFLLWGIPDR